MKSEAEIPVVSVAEPVRRSARGRVVAGAAVVTGVAVVGWVLVQAPDGDAGGDARSTREVRPPVAVSTAAVVRSDVANRRVVNGTLGYAGTADVVVGRTGVMTWVPAIGTVVGRGKPVFEIDGARVPLLYGERPAWRDLALGVRDGVDVRQLERNLAALGYGKGLTVDRHFSLATYYALRRWQRAARLPVTGSVPLGRVAFAPGAVRVGRHEVVVGGRVAAGQVVVHGTGTRPAVLVRLNPAELPRIRVGDPVVVTLPDGGTRKAKISSVARVAVSADTDGDGDTSSAVPATIMLRSGARGFLDRALVQVAIISERRGDVLAVPVSALLARTLGRYEVVVVDGGVRRRVAVRTGLFDETSGLAEVTGALTPGMLVEVPDDGA